MQVKEKVATLFQELKQVKRENDSLMQKLSNNEASEILDQVEEINGVNVLAEQVNVGDMNQLRSMVDDLKQKLDSGIILLAAVNDGKVQLAAGVSADLVKQGYHAGKMIKQAAEICGGGGGGRPDMAQAGGKKPEMVAEALKEVKKLISAVK